MRSESSGPMIRSMIVMILALVGALLGWAATWRRLRAAQRALQRTTRLRSDERQGRIRAEKQLSELARNAQAATAGDSGEQRNGSKPIPLRTIGWVESCFKKRQGTPRQSGLVAEARAALHLDARIVPAAALEGLEEFSHVWIVYAFHQNTNDHKLRGAAGASIKGKIQVPRLDGAKRGVFATRSPHRPNAIGLSLGRILEIRPPHSILVGAADVVHGSPLLDLKPLVPFCDCPRDACAPRWVDAAPEGDPLRVDAVEFADGARRRLEQVWAQASSSSLYSSARDLQAAVASCLSRDVRSLNQRQRGREGQEYALDLDCVRVRYAISNAARASPSTSVADEEEPRGKVIRVVDAMAPPPSS